MKHDFLPCLYRQEFSCWPRLIWTLPWFQGQYRPRPDKSHYLLLTFEQWKIKTSLQDLQYVIGALSQPLLSYCMFHSRFLTVLKIKYSVIPSLAPIQFIIRFLFSLFSLTLKRPAQIRSRHFFSFFSQWLSYCSNTEVTISDSPLLSTTHKHLNLKL